MATEHKRSGLRYRAILKDVTSPVMSKVQYFIIVVLIYFMLVALYYQVRHYTLRYPKIVKAVLIICFLGWGALLFDCIRDIMTSVILKS